MDSGQHCGSVQDLINLTQNLDCYDFHPGVDDEEMLGRLYVEDMESLEVPDNIKPYFDFEAVSYTHLDVYKRQPWETAAQNAAIASTREIAAKLLTELGLGAELDK